MRPVRVVGLGGSLRQMSTSRTALQVALEGAAASGVRCCRELRWAEAAQVREQLPVGNWSAT